MSDADTSATADPITRQHVTDLFGLIATRSNSNLIDLFTTALTGANLTPRNLFEYGVGRSSRWGINAGPNQSFAIGLRTCIELPEALAIFACCIGPEHGNWTVYQGKERLVTLHGVAPYENRPAGQTVTAVLADVLNARERITARAVDWVAVNHLVADTEELRQFANAIHRLGLERRLKRTSDGFGVVEGIGRSRRWILLKPSAARVVFSHRGFSN